MTSKAQTAAALGAGAIFGFGLALSGMLDPARVRGFLDIGGAFDPSLAFVLVGAVTVSSLGYLVSRRLQHPALVGSFHLPTKTVVDRRLVLGSAIFGVGWGAAGFCPGPAVAALSLGLAPVFLFAAMMCLGVLIHDHWPELRRLGAQRGADAQT
ncbi:YeeE/YedE family protein [Methylocapsa acidiphila]|uniref:YeeE/YedE family protein n=1 Tax=Methylocapsa acidiphila TaxID=133552 RepID=UPI00040F9C3C|nr:YeeE/YedE family protein [Methylocapsa acidiphila]